MKDRNGMFLFPASLPSCGMLTSNIMDTFATSQNKLPQQIGRAQYRKCMICVVAEWAPKVARHLLFSGGSNHARSSGCVRC
jgi:hypothetical protein